MTLHTTCPYCGVGCGVTVIDGIPRGDPNHPENYGRLCSKGAALKETLNLPDRLTQPMIHGEAASWDTALNTIAQAFTRIRNTQGPDAIAFYVSGQFLTEDYYVANKLMKGFIGSGNIDTNSRLCMASSVAGHQRAFGEDVVPGCYEDLEEADLVVQAGSNMAWCHPVLYQRLMLAREKRRTKIVTIDPRRTATAATADLHLPVASGTDVALFNGLLAYLSDAGAVDHSWIAAHVSGFDETLEEARRCAPSLETAAEKVGLPAGDLQGFYELFARTERVVTLYSQGVNQSACGTDKVNAILNCHLATGRIGRSGMGPFSVTGQPNAMGGREVGGLANQLAAHMAFMSEDIDRVRRFWKAPHMAVKPGLKAVDLFEAIGEGRVQAVWIAATNPADSMPRAHLVRDALARCPLVIVSDAWPTDTTALAHVVLPAAGWGEKSGTVTNSERRISRQRAFRSAPGEARPDWWMFTEVGRRMGFEKSFTYRSPADVFREHAALSAFENDGRRIFDIGALADLDDAAYDALLPLQWPWPRRGRGHGGPRLFSGGTFPTTDGRARMVPVAFSPKENDGGDSLTLNTGRTRDQWHTMTRTGRVPRLMIHMTGPRLVMHPSDAARRGIEDDGLAQIASPHGQAILRVSLDAMLRPSEVFVPMHWTNQFCSSGPIDRLVHGMTDPVSGQPDLKGTKVEAAAVTECWRGYLLRSSDGDPAPGETVFWSKRPIARGFAFDLSGWTLLAKLIPSEAALRRLLHAPEEADIISYSDPKKSVFRYAALVRGRLEACVFFASPRSAFPEAEQVSERLGQTLEPGARFSLLSGVDSGAAAPARIVCACFAVKEAAISHAIRSEKLTTTVQIGALLQAGTDCGSCIPELKKLLADIELPAVA